MTSTTRGRRLLVGVVAALLPGLRRHDIRPAAEPGRDQAPNTVLTVNVRSCEGCEITLVSYLDGDMGAGWALDPHTVQNGKAAFGDRPRRRRASASWCARRGRARRAT